MEEDKIYISEIFGPTVQGEGSLIGQPTVFVRTGGCDYFCSFCDTLYAVLEQYRKDWTPMTAEEIMAQIKQLSNNKPILVTLSGGNPAQQPLRDLIRLGQFEDYTFCIETQGSVAADWFTDLDYVIFSPKPPSSLMKTDWGALENCVKMCHDRHKMGTDPNISFKVVVSDERDYTYAKEVFDRFPQFEKFISPCNISPGDPDLDSIYEKMRWITDMMLKDGIYDVRITPQMHVLMYGNERGK